MLLASIARNQHKVYKQKGKLTVWLTRSSEGVSSRVGYKEPTFFLYFCPTVCGMLVCWLPQF